ncbi:MAG: MFS transporter [Nocardioidaceae bacterium]
MTAFPTTRSPFAEPVERVPRSWVVWITLAGLGLWAAWFGPIQVLLAQQAEAIAPHHKEYVFGLVNGLGAAVSVVATPLTGAWSDRTTSRFGRRLPWVLGGAVGGALSLVLLAYAHTVLVMAVAWCLAQFALNAMFAALTATVPDQVPVGQRGVVGGWVSVSQTLGIVGGVGIATAAGGIRAGYLATAVVVVALAIPYLFASRDLPLPRLLRSPFVLREFLSGFWLSPRRYPDFAWAWLTRFLVNLGNSMGTLLLYFFLQDAVHYRHPATGVLVLTVIYAIFIVAFTVAFGRWSDRIGRRKVFVVWSGVVTGLAALTLAVIPTWPGAIAGAVLLGAGYGVYLSVDFALCTEVLPTAGARAKDLGVINVANALPQVFAPVLGSFIVAALGGYKVMFSVAAAVCILGSVFVRNIRSVP